VQLPGFSLCFPDNHVFSGIRDLSTRGPQRVLPHLHCGFTGSFDLERVELGFLEAEIHGALPECTDGVAACDDGTVGRQKLASGRVESRQAGGIATIGSMFWRESTLTDYGNRPGIGAGRKIGMLKPQFKSNYDSGTAQDFGTIAVKSAAAA